MLFGLTIFELLHWFWKTLQWSNELHNAATITWFELALDFHACTHCPLHMPDQTSDQLTIYSIASFFMRASKRMAALCKSKMCPAEFLEHCDSLTALGFQRMTGFSKRPRLRCPAFVHRQLLDIVHASGKCSVIKNRGTFIKLPLLKLQHAPPKKIQISHRKRLTGKQPPPVQYQPQKQRRVVKSHKAQILDVQWTPEELAINSDKCDTLGEIDTWKKIFCTTAKPNHSTNILFLSRD